MAVMMLTATGTINAQDNVNIGKSNIRLQSDLMTPEALWAMGRIGGVEAAPDGSVPSGILQCEGQQGTSGHLRDECRRFQPPAAHHLFKE